MIAVLLTEMAKLKRSLIVFLCAGSPLFVAGMTLLFVSGPAARPGGRPSMQAMLMGWPLVTEMALRNWAFFVLPLSAMALAILSAQVEHGPKAWNWVLAQPVPRWKLFLGKVILMLGLVALMTVAIYLLIPVVGLIRNTYRAELPGHYDWAGVARKLGMMYAGAVFMIALLMWTALRFRSFVPALGLGLVGGFLAVAVSVARVMDEDPPVSEYLPWLLPVNVMSRDPGLPGTVWVGLACGIVVFALMILDLSRRDAP